MSRNLPQIKAFHLIAPLAAVVLLAGCPPTQETPQGPLALFSAAITSGQAPLSVTFANESVAGTSPITFQRWDFGDGTTSEDENPVHIYNAKGKYTVTLTIATVVGVDRRTRLDYIDVRGDTGPRAEFSAVKREGIAPFSVTFSDDSPAGTEEITSWLWDFGDGTTSTEQNPKHIYTKIGRFDVSLTVESSVGDNTETKGAFVITHGKDLALGGAAADRAFGVLATDDGRYVLAGDTESAEDGSRDVSLIITDAFGNAAAEKHFGGEDDESAAGLAPAGDGGFLIAGTVDYAAGGSDALLIRTDASGNRIWSKSYGGAGDERAEAIAATRDGGAVLAGSTAEDEIAGSLAWATRVDSEGRIVWTHTYGAGRFTGVVADGAAFALCGASADGQDARVLKLDGQGTVVFDTTLGGEGEQRAAGVALLPAGGYAVAGASVDLEDNSDAWVAMLSAAGVSGWSKTLGGAGQDRANAVVAPDGGGIVIAGSSQAKAGTLDDAYLAALTDDGEIDWEASFGGAKADRANALIAEEDGFALAGSTESFGPAGTNMYLVKTDELGEQQSFPLAGR